MKPLVSVVIPSFNQGAFIGETVESVLSQSYRPLEVIVMDGASTDETPRVLQRFGSAPEMRMRSEPDEGVADAVNKGLREARGSIVAIQSSDDVYLPGAIAAAVESMHANPDAALVFGDVEHIDEHSRVTGRDLLAAFDLAEYLGRLTYIPQPAAFFRAAAAREIGGWRREVSYVADADYWMRIALRHPVVKIDRLMARYRYHPGQRDRHRERILQDWERMMQELLGDRRMTPRLRRFARMGVHLARHRYTGEERWALRTLHLYRAALANPACVVHRHFPKRELFPGRTPIWALLSRIKRALGVLVLDWPRFELGLRSSWLHIRNRAERLRPSPDRRGVACLWQWTSDLHAPKVFPVLGQRLMRRCLADWPIRFAQAPASGGEPLVSFVLGHRGLARAPLLLATLSTIAAQRGVSLECIVVEQSARSEIGALLPAWVRHIHTPPPIADMPYCRSWTLNVGARAARGRVLVFHDGDMLVPEAYAAQILARVHDGYDAVNLKRFIFYLGEAPSAVICAEERGLSAAAPEAVVQNLEAGGSVAMSREAFFAIGGFDESFVGWGGEDNEFWQRALTRKAWTYGYLPLVHLWHAPQPGKAEQQRASTNPFRERAALAPEQRIRALVQRGFGDVRHMDPEPG